MRSSAFLYRNYVLVDLYPSAFMYSFCKPHIICRSDKEMHKRQDMLSSLRSKAKEMASSFNISNFSSRFAYIWFCLKAVKKPFLKNKIKFGFSFFFSDNIRDDLLGPSTKTADEINRAAGLDSHGIVGLQRQIMRGTPTKCTFLQYSKVSLGIYMLLSTIYRTRWGSRDARGDST